MRIQIRDRNALSQVGLSEVIIDAIVGLEFETVGGSKERMLGDGGYLVSAREVLCALRQNSRPAFCFLKNKVHQN